LRWPAAISSNGRGRVSVSLILLVVAIVLFVLAALGVTLGSVLLVPLGLAFLAASFLPV
jgi:hypothetical protein